MNKERLWILLAKKFNDELTPEELAALNLLLSQNSETTFKVEMMEQLWKTPSITKTDEELSERIWNKISDAVEEESTPVRLSLKSYFIAAATLLFLCIGSWLLLTKNDKYTGINEVSTNGKSHSKVLLPDGTIVWLNSNSKIIYNEGFGQTKRKITLTGEAFFEVAYNKNVPLQVQAKSVNITVKGTSFNVMAYPEDENVETSLISGSVELSVQEYPERKILLRPNEKISVRVIQEIKSTTSGRAEKESSDSLIMKKATPDRMPQVLNLYEIKALNSASSSSVIPEISWMENKLVFNSEPLAEVIKKMERWYDISIIIEDEELKARKFTGVFSKETITQALNALQLTCQFKYYIKENKVFINYKTNKSYEINRQN